jgi:hypothetical protein
VVVMAVVVWVLVLKMSMQKKKKGVVVGRTSSTVALSVIIDLLAILTPIPVDTLAVV